MSEIKKALELPINRTDPDWLFMPQDKQSICIKYDLKMDPVRGLGVFASEFVPQGTVVSYHTDMCLAWDKKTTLDFFSTVSYEAGYNMLVYGGVEDDYFFLDLDDAKYFNHSHESPTIVGGESFLDFSTGKYYTDPYIAIRDIQPGEEILVDYREWGPSPSWFVELCKKYNLDADRDCFIDPN